MRDGSVCGVLLNSPVFIATLARRQRFRVVETIPEQQSGAFGPSERNLGSKNRRALAALTRHAAQQ